MPNKKIRCQHTKPNGKPCNNYIARVVGDEIIVKRYGREVHIQIGQPLEIKCERCGGITKIGGNGEK